MRHWHWGLALAIAGCAVPPPAARATATLVVDLAPTRTLQAVAQSWHAADVFEYDLALAAYDPATQTYLPASQTAVLPQKPTASTQAAFGGLVASGRYRVTVTAKGNAGGTAPDTVLNARHPATADFDLGATPPVTHQTVAVALDPSVFALTLQLPSNATTPGSVPKWVTRLDASLADAASPTSPIATATYLPTQTMAFQNVRGDRHYTLALTVHSPTGQSTSTIPDFVVARADGAPLAVTPTFPTFVPPTGTLLATYTLAGSTYGIAVDPRDHLWVTNQHGNTVSEIDASGAAVVPPIPVGNSPRGVAVDQATSDVWVGESTFFGHIDKIAGGAVVGSFSGATVPGGVAVDSQHRVWVVDAVSGSVVALDASGQAIAGSPFTVGTQPVALAVDATTGDVWVTNSGSNSVSKITATGTVLGPFAAGTQPGGVAIAPDHTAWVSCNGDGTVRRYNPDGSAAAAPINLGNGPSVMAIDPTTGAAWVTLLNGNQVAKLAPDGTKLGTFPAGTFPAGIAIDHQHHIWIAGSGNVCELAP